MCIVTSVGEWILTGLVLFGCGGGTEIRGNVTSMPGAGTDGRYVPSKAIPRARVEVECRTGAVPSFVLIADDKGSFSKDLRYALDNYCRIRASSPGYAPRIVRVIAVCALGHEHQCSAVSVSVRLMPEVQQ
jgi:hypothetical protein